MKRLREKRGFSLAEAAISLAVIVIVTVAALSLALTSITVRKKTVQISYAQAFAANVYECFVAAENEKEFVDLVKFAEEVDLSDGNTTDDVLDKTYECTEKNYKAYVAVSYDKNRPDLEVTVTNGDGDEIISYTYAKGARK